MKEEIIKIAKDLEQNQIKPQEARKLLLCLFGVSGEFSALQEFTKNWIGHCEWEEFNRRFKLFAEKYR